MRDVQTRERDREPGAPPRPRRVTDAGAPAHGSRFDPILHLQRTLGNRGVQRLLREGAEAPRGVALRPAPLGALQPKLTVGAPGDAYEMEADRAAEQVMRMPQPEHVCDCGGTCDECRRRKERRLQAKPAPGGAPGAEAPPLVEEVVSSHGRPLDGATREFMEPRFGADFGEVRLHTDEKAAESARAVGARAYTVGRDVVFGAGQYAPASDDGRRLLAHELAHVVQQGGGSPGAEVRRRVVPTSSLEPPLPSGERPLPRETIPAAAPRGPAPVPAPESCAPPEDLACAPAATSPGAVSNTLVFPVDSAVLNPLQQAEVDAAAALWRTSGGAVTVRIDGYASAEGECGYNWRLSCRRAQAVAARLASPGGGAPGVPAGRMELFAHGETAESGRALSPNRMATISVPTLPPPPVPPVPACPLPVLLGRARGCGAGTDFTHFDFPAISTTSALKLAAWAQALVGSPNRMAVPNFMAELEMDAVLSGLAGSEGHAAFARFAAGTGGTATHGASSPLGALALASGSFARTVAAVKADIEAQLAAQAAAGVLNPCGLRVTPPATFFGFADGVALKTVIGGTQGEELIATGFSGSIPLRTYSIDLRFVICDDFGVDEADLYSPGLFGFWVLQHERSRSLYAPFINELDLPVTISGTF